MTKPHIKYRPDIDGLRALAVVSVMIFHFNSDWLSGGFLGVDIFFVISGYLITSIIARQIEEKRFTFRDFYTRRIKRILPLFFTVLVVTVMIAALLFDTRDYESFWHTAKYAMQFRANRAFGGQGYFDPISEEKPLLHLWSLAIEEQFYFIWPLTFVFIYRLIKTKKEPFKWAFWITIIGIAASLIFTQYRLSTQPAKAYFELSTRASELLIGCALALNPYQLNDRYKRYLGLFSIIVLVLCFTLYSSEIPFPGVFALIPTLAAALFIFDTNINAPYKKIFTYKPIRLIGLWSFSLYLWHWPVLAFMRYILNDTQLPISWMLAGISLIFALSIVTYYCVENPIRRVKLKFIGSFGLIYLLSAGLIITIHQITISKPASSMLHLDDSRELTQWAEGDQLCMDRAITDQCYVGLPNAPTKILTIGDSHTGHLSSFMDVIGKHENFRAHMIASGGCGFPPSEGMTNVSRRNANSTCLAINEYLLTQFKAYDAIAISQYLAPKLEEPTEIAHNYSEKFKATVEILAKERPVYLISDIPTLSIPSPARYVKLKKLGLDQYLMHKDKYSAENANHYLQDLAATIPNVYFIDMNQFIPSNGVLNQKPIYFDDNHLNLYGSKTIGELFIKENSFLQKNHPIN